METEVKHFGKFALYNPLPGSRPELESAIGTQILYARNQSGEDFYDLQKKMTPRALLVCIDKAGVVLCAGLAPDQIFPPAGSNLYQVTGSAPLDRDAVGQLFDPSTGTFTRRPTPEVIESLSALEIRQALRDAGLKTAFDAWIAKRPAEEREEWEYGTEVRRDSRLITGFAAAKPLTDDEVRSLFRRGPLA